MFLSSQTVQGQFTAESATQNEDHHEDTKQFKLKHLNLNQFSFLFLLSFKNLIFPYIKCTLTRNYVKKIDFDINKILLTSKKTRIYL